MIAGPAGRPFHRQRRCASAAAFELSPCIGIGPAAVRGHLYLMAVKKKPAASMVLTLRGKRRVVLIANVNNVKGPLVLVVINESGVSAGYGCSQTCRYCSGGKCTGASRHGNTVRTSSRGSRHACWPGRRRCRRQSRRASLPPALPERL